MDRSRYKRPEIKTQRHTTNTTFGNPQPVPKAVSAHTSHALPVYRRPVAPRRPGMHQAQPVQHRPLQSQPVAQPAVVRPQPAVPAQPIRVQKPAPQVVPIARKPLKPASAGPMAVAAATAPSQTQVRPEQLARQVPLDMDLPGEDSESHFSKFMQRTKWGRVRRVALRSTAVAMVLLITVGGLVFSQGYFKLNNVFRGGAETAAALEKDVKPELLKGEGRGRVNVLLLGRGGGEHSAPDLTDTIMVASIDPVNKTATLLSVPRDMWVNVPNHGVMKLNAAWQSGVHKYLGKQVNGTNDPKAIQAGYNTVNAALEEVLGLEIDYNLIVNFQAFKQAVDTVGGVTVNVPADLVDPSMAWENNNNPVLAPAGLQTFDGNKALMYTRSRDTSSDFARGDRQRAVLVALKAKVVTMNTLSNPSKLSKLVGAFGDNVQTDLSIKNATRLYSIIKGINDSKVTSLSLADPNQPLVTTGNVNGQSVVLPKDGLFKYQAIQEYLRGQLKDPYIMREGAKVLVLNGTTVPGMATAKAEELKTYGYNVVGATNTPNPGWVTTTLVDLTKRKKYTKNYLEQRLGQTASNQLADTTIPTNGADFVIIIGSDKANPQ